MCGFAGIVYTDPARPVDPAALKRAAAQIAHRGPDDEGFWQAPGAGMVHRRLSILDLSPGGRQPFRVHDERYVIAYNGEVYNFAEIRKTLEQRGETFRTTCDTEVVAKALAHWGDEALARFNGMFALAFFDTETRRLLLARDRLGIKPIFYHAAPEGLYFASELEGLRACADRPFSIDPSALDSYFTYLYIPGPETIYREARQLSPATVLTWQGGAHAVSRYWTLTYSPQENTTLEDCADAFRAHLRDSVRLRQVSDVPLGAFLSGGVDSTAVVATLAELAVGPVKTFTIGFADEEADELAFARAAADRFGTDHTEAILRPDMIDLLPRLQRHFGQPFADSSALPMWLVSQIARETVTVALSGDGGDELFAGYAWSHMHHRVNQYRHVPEGARRAIDGVVHLLPNRPRWARYKRFSRDSFLSDVEGYRRRQTCLARDVRTRLLREHAPSPDRFAEHAAAYADLTPDDRMLALDTQQYLPDDILTKVDRMSMGHGLEARVPLLDHRVVTFAATLPFDLKFRRGVSKRVVKQAFARDFPPALLRQRKRGFSLPIHRWFRESLGDHFRDRVLAPDAPVGTWINPDVAGQIFREHAEGRVDWGHALWAMLCLAVWLEALQR